ncbi:MAG: AMP-binding protein [Synergistaceae bacterium]|nr:AMP-binding protein [Synergistaceae bacterium]
MQRGLYEKFFSYDRLDVILDEYLNSKPDANCYYFNSNWHARKDLKILADDFTSLLKAAGFKKGQRLVALMPNSPMTLAIIIAAWRLGGVFCPLNEKSGKLSLLRTLNLLKPFAVIISQSVKQELADALRENDWPVIICPDEAMPDAKDFQGKLQEDESEELAVIFSTSGTTGDPKAVPLTHKNIIDNCLACLENIYQLEPEDRFLNVLPNFHAFGFTVSIILPLLCGASLVIVPGFMPPSNTLKAIIETKANLLLLVPTMAIFLTGLLERNNQKLDHVKLLILGGDKYNYKLDERIKNSFGVGVLEGYGITECSPVLSVNHDEQTKKLGTVGPALTRFEIQLRDEAGNVLEKTFNNEGVLWTRGPSVTSGYYHAPEINHERFKDGWFNTGDYVKIDSDGYIKILDRVTDIIIVGGFNVYPQEVEAILSEHPAVQTSVVIGTPNSMSGEVPKAFIIKNKDAEVSETDLIKFCKERLSHYKVPRAVEFVESLPLSSTGKILRRVLREQEREKAKKNKI